MNTRTLGKNGPRVSALGLGCSSMSDFSSPAERAESIATLNAALDAGITLLDTADFYDNGMNEQLLHEALQGRPRDQYQLSVKFGALRDPAGRFIGYDARPQAIKSFLGYSLHRLGVDYIDIYRPARLDAQVPIEETIGAIAEMVQAGYVRAIGLSEVGAETIRRAQAAHPIADLQIEYSLLSRGMEAQILPTCRELGISITAYGVLSHGLLSGSWNSDVHSYVNGWPRFQGANLEHNLALVEALRAIATAKGISIAQLALAWVLARGEDIVPLVGMRRRARLPETLAAPGVKLSADELAQIDRIVPIGAAAGERYPTPLMSLLDSERSSRAHPHS